MAEKKPTVKADEAWLYLEGDVIDVELGKWEKSGKPYCNFVIEKSDEVGDKVYKSQIPFDVVEKAMSQSPNRGDRVKVMFFIKGNKSKTGKYFAKLTAYKIETLFSGNAGGKTDTKQNFAPSADDLSFLDGGSSDLPF